MSDHDELDAIRASLESWETEYAQHFEINERKKRYESESGIPYKRVYTPLDIDEKGHSYMKDLGMPGNYPYTRGRTCSGQRDQSAAILPNDVWSHGTPEENNKLWKTMFGRGAVPFLVVAYDLACLRGYDPDDPRAEGQIGTVGLSFASLRDWEIALDGIDIKMLPIYHAVSSLPSIVLAYQAAVLHLRGLDVSQMLGVIQNDFTKDYTVGNYCIFPLKHAMRQNLDVICWCNEHAPFYLPLDICSYHQWESGVTPVQATAITMAAAIYYLEAARERGVDVDSFAPKIITNDGGTHATFWENIATLRAFRRIWAKTLRDRFGAKYPESMRLKGSVGNGGSLACKQEYLNNITRTTLAALSGILAGEGIRIVPPTEALGVPDAEATYFALQAQRIIYHETDICDVVDPLGGSYFVESLTSEVEERIWKELDTIEKHGGMMRCIETGYFQKMRTDSCYKWQTAFDRGDIVRVGVNRFVSPELQQAKPVFTPYRSNPESERQRIAAIQELRRKRDNEKVKKALSDVKVVAAAEPTPENNIMPPIIEAVKCYATIGEIADALREVWGEYQGLGTKVF
ncbi:methylmalonyl-CoA mutase family protein [Chloroflexota bacterium]